jgi:predicted metal-binding transcription factor (methanogenesis marker protein 9)
LSTTKQDTVHDNSEYAKVTELENGNILVLSTLVNEQKSTLSIYDRDGRCIYGNQILENGYSASAEIVSKYIDEKSQEYFLFFP